MARDRASRPEARPLRLFVAIDLPESVRHDLATAIREAAVRHRIGGAGIRWVPPENWHLTIKFLGSTWPRLLTWVTEVCGRVAAAFEPFEASLSRAGAFPSVQRARILWVASEFEVEKRPFSAHVTVARLRVPENVVDHVARLHVSEARFPVDRLVLYRSHLGRPAPRYEPIREFPLGG